MITINNNIGRRLMTLMVLIILGVLLVNPQTKASTLPGLLPDLRTVVPQHLQLVNDHQREVLRFSNAIANTGDGPWRMRPKFPLADQSQI